MKIIQGIKMGTTINYSINGKLKKKVCKNIEEADKLFSLILKAKANPTDDNINEINFHFNESLRRIYKTKTADFEIDVESGLVYLAGFNTPIPDKMFDVIKEYEGKEFPLDAIINFWKLLMINPDLRIRDTLFDFIKTHDFVITDKGYMLVYKAVYLNEDVDQDNCNNLDEIVSNFYFKIKKNWKTSPNKYVLYKDSDDKFNITKLTTADSWDVDDKNVDIIGKVGDLYDAIILNKKDNDNHTNVQKVVYTDMHSRTMRIVLGEPVYMNRSECNSDPANECSFGLHVGATKYVQSYATKDSIVLACLVNPAHVVAVPKYDNSKMRVSEYYPFAVVDYSNRKIDIAEEMYFENDYCTYEAADLQKLIDKVKSNEIPIKSAQNAENDNRSMSELMKILQTRLLDLK